MRRLLRSLLLALAGLLVLGCGAAGMLETRSAPRWACPSPTPRPWGSAGQILLLLGEPGDINGKKSFIPLRLESGQRGPLALALKRLYQRYRVTPDTPATGTPTLCELVPALEELRDPIATMFAQRLRYLIYGSLHATDELTPDGLAFAGPSTIDWRFDQTIVYYDFSGVPELHRALYYSQAMGRVWRYARTRPLTRDLFLQIDEFGHASQIAAVADTAWTMAKTARKYRLGMVLVDQTMRPFLMTDGGRQLHANAAAHFFFHMQDVEAEEVAQAMRVITPRHQQFIRDAEPGQCLGVIRKDVYAINVECHDLEAAAFVHG